MFFSDDEMAKVYNFDQYGIADIGDPERFVLRLRAENTKKFANFAVRVDDAAGLAGFLLSAAQEKAKSLPAEYLDRASVASTKNRPFDPAEIKSLRLLDGGRTLGLDLGFGVMVLSLPEPLRAAFRSALNPDGLS